MNEPEQAALLAEQRRVFYVAITRTTETLVISSVARMERAFALKVGAELVAGHGQFGTPVASRFIAELGPAAPRAVAGASWVHGGY